MLVLRKESEFSPFYEKIPKFFGIGILGKLVISGLLGSSFLLAHLLSIKKHITSDWSWFLGLLITVAMLCLYYATIVLRNLLSEMTIISAPNCYHYYLTFKRKLSDKNFIKAGLFFGFINCGFGYAFGIPYNQFSAVITIFYGFFLAGIVCGMAVWGIYGILVLIIDFAQKSNFKIDFTSPDCCGGTSFFGEALVVFASVTLIVGMMISTYILKTNWARIGSTWWIVILKWFWIAFPYAMSLIVIIVPSIAINKVLKEYKKSEDAILRKKLEDIFKRLEDKQIYSEERQELRNDSIFQQKIRDNLHKMRTWPFNLNSNLKYFSVLVANLYASFTTLNKTFWG